LGGLAYALLLHWHAPPQQSTAVEICVMVFSFLPVVIWTQVQTTPVYTVVKTEQQPVSNLAATNYLSALRESSFVTV
jgi:hypothetical protein